MVDAGPSEVGANAGEQLGKAEWLRHVVDGAGVEPDDDVDLLLRAPSA